MNWRRERGARAGSDGMRRRVRPVALVLLVACAAGAFPGLASAIAPESDTGGAPGQPIDVPVRALLSVAAAPAGGDANLAVIYEVPPKAHIQMNDFFYAQPADGEPFTLGDPIRPAGEKLEDDIVFRGRTTVFYPVHFAPGAKPGNRPLRLLAGYQACIEEPVFACFPPVEDTLAIPIELVAAGGAARQANSEIFASLAASGNATAGAPSGSSAPSGSGAPAAAPAPAEEGGLAGRLERALASRSILAFFIVFLGGVASSFTPCVYPMIPITISYIGGRSRTRLGGLFLSIFFVLGIALTYSTLGIVAASTGALFGSAMQSVPVIIVVSLVFFTMGASMLGAFDIALPSGMQTRLQAGPHAGIVGALFMGMVTGLVASPCVGPVVVVLLTWVAKIGSIGLGFLLLFVFALGLGLLFLVLGTFAGALNALPQAGSWMETVKYVFGVILIAMGIYYVRGLIGPNLTWIVFGAFVLLVGTFLGAFKPAGEEATHGTLFRKGVGILLVLTGGFVFLVGLARSTGVPLGAPGGGERMAAAGAAGAAGGEAALAWMGDDKAGLALAAEQKKPAVMDFYADWCGACKELDEKTWPNPDVREEGQRFVAIKLNLTQRNDWSKSKQDSYRVPGLPTVIFFDSSGREVERFFGFRPPDQVLASMRKIH